MRRINSFTIVIIFIASIFVIILIPYIYQLRNNNLDQKDYKELATKLKSCFDLDNKSDRGIEESIKLIEYCMDIYGLE